MLSPLKSARKVVGAKQLTRALETGAVSRVYVALDAEPFVTKRILALCREQNIPVVDAPSMKELGASCGIQVGTAAAGLLR